MSASMAVFKLTDEQLGLITSMLGRAAADGVVPTFSPFAEGALKPKMRDLHQLFQLFDGEVTITGPIHVSGVESEKVTVRNPADQRDRDAVAEHDDLTRLTMAAARVIGDRRDLISLDAQAGTSGEDRDVAVAHLERSLNDLADVLSVVINRQEARCGSGD